MPCHGSEPITFLKKQTSEACKNYNACDREAAQMGLNGQKEKGLLINTCLPLRDHPGNFSPLGPESSLKYISPRCIGRCVEGRPINSYLGKVLKSPLFLEGNFTKC